MIDFLIEHSAALNQLMIMILGMTSIACISTTNLKIMKWGFFFGMMAEPYWMFSSIMHEQFGISVLVCVYTVCHLKGYIITCKKIAHPN